MNFNKVITHIISVLLTALVTGSITYAYTTNGKVTELSRVVDLNTTVIEYMKKDEARIETRVIEDREEANKRILTVAEMMQVLIKQNTEVISLIKVQNQIIKQ